MEPTVSLEDVTRIFGRFAALRGVSFEFLPGRLYVLVGENGAGKSTLLRIITGLLKPSSGKVFSRGKIGYMAHAPMLYDELSAMENLGYFAELYGVDGRACERAIRTVALDPALDRPVRDYSQGMRQRLSLARAILHDPDVLLLDEPFSNVDAQSTSQMAALLSGLRDQGNTLIVVTHQPEALRSGADEFLQMSGGLLVDRTAARQQVQA